MGRRAGGGGKRPPQKGGPVVNSAKRIQEEGPGGFLYIGKPGMPRALEIDRFPLKG